jgi:hypothetical protein
MWVVNGPLGPDYPMPEESVPGAIGSTYPLPESSTLTIGMPSDQGAASAGSSTLGLETPSLEIPQVETSVETFALELPSVLEAGKDTSEPGARPPREKLLPEHRNRSVPRTMNRNQGLPPWNPVPDPKGDWQAKLAYAMYALARFYTTLDQIGADEIFFGEEW